MGCLMEEDGKADINLIKVCLSVIPVFFIAGIWGATEYVAYQCDFDPLLGSNILGIYWPFKYFEWCDLYTKYIPDILSSAKMIMLLLWGLGIGILVLYKKYHVPVDTSHGSAHWATQKEISKLGLEKGEGVILGVNPNNNKLLQDDGDTHICVVAPTRSGKGVGIIVPTLLTWKHSVFVTDVKGENWNLTAGFRKNVLKQKVLKFDPLSDDGSSAHWNPLTEINFRTSKEYSDVQNIVSILSDTGDEKGGGGGNDYFKQAGINLLQGVVLHLMYEAYREKKPLPTLTDCSNFLSSPERSIEEQLQYMKIYPHMSVKEFLQPTNIFEEIYGDYISNYMVFQDLIAGMPQYSSEDGEEPEEKCPEITCLNDLKEFVRTHLPEDMLEDETVPMADLNEEEVAAGKYIDIKSEPWCLLLSHPRIASKATEVLNKADKEQSGVISMAKTCLSVYENPNIAKNLAYSDFKIKDLLTLEYEVSLYLVIPPSELEVLKNLVRLFIEFILRTLVVRMEAEKREESPEFSKWEELIAYFEDMKNSLEKNIKEKFTKNKSKKNVPKKKQRLLLMCDEFPQFGTLTSLETALAVMAGYGLRACLIAQDVNQLAKRYTERNSITSNCLINVFYTPNQETNNATAKMISETLGNKTIQTQSRTKSKETSTSTQSTGRSLMTADEVSHMSKDKALILAAGTFAIMANKLHYFKHKYFTKRLMDPPILSDVITPIRNFDDLMEKMQGYYDDLAARKEKVRIAREARGDFEHEMSKMPEENIVEPEHKDEQKSINMDDLPDEQITEMVQAGQEAESVENTNELAEFTTGETEYYDTMMSGHTSTSEEAEEKAVQAAIENERTENNIKPAVKDIKEGQKENSLNSQKESSESKDIYFEDGENEFDGCEDVLKEHYGSPGEAEENSVKPNAALNVDNIKKPEGNHDVTINIPKTQSKNVVALEDGENEFDACENVFSEFYPDDSAEPDTVVEASHFEDNSADANNTEEMEDVVEDVVAAEDGEDTSKSSNTDQVLDIFSKMAE